MLANAPSVVRYDSREADGAEQKVAGKVDSAAGVWTRWTETLVRAMEPGK